MNTERCNCDLGQAGLFHTICSWDPPPKPSIRITYVLEGGVSLTESVKKAEDAVSILGALCIDSCEVAGDDGDGWYVTVTARS